MSDELQANNLPEEVSLINETDPTKLRQLIDIFNLNSLPKKSLCVNTKPQTLLQKLISN